jgi:transcriptional regulator with XRE-family HTH domain|nr:helix-turn-helix transcriptional regulator [Candidatus Microthrix sp.]
MFSTTSKQSLTLSPRCCLYNPTLHCLHEEPVCATIRYSTYMETTSKSFDGSQNPNRSGQTKTALTRLLFELRAAQELSLFELANRTGINRSTLMRIENGTSIRPDTQTIRALAKALGVEPEDFWDAIWQDRSKQPASKAEVLPSPAVYLRSKYRLSEHQAKQAEDYLAKLASPPSNPTSLPATRRRF